MINEFLVFVNHDGRTRAYTYFKNKSVLLQFVSSLQEDGLYYTLDASLVFENAETFTVAYCTKGNDYISYSLS